MPMTKVKTAKTDKAQKLAKANKAATTQKVVSRRELKYIYPRGMTDPLKRKAYRQKIRNAANKMELAISKLKGEEKRVMKAKLDAHQDKHMRLA